MKIKAGKGRSFGLGSVITAKLLEIRQTMKTADILHLLPSRRIGKLH
jgi:hypothetical protein